MGWFSKKSSQSSAADQGVDWSQLEVVRAEWPASDLDAAADLASWREGMALYDSRDDYASMIEAGRQMCRALRHHLYGRGVLFGTDLPNTTHRVLFASCSSPPDGSSFPENVRAQVRLGLAIVKKHGWQSVEHGGDGMMEETMPSSMLLRTSVAPTPDRGWEGDVKQFFTSNPFAIPDEDSPPPTTMTPQPLKPPAQQPTREHRIMQAMWEISRESGGEFVSSVAICQRVGENAITLGLSNVLERLEDEGLIEHHVFEDRTGGDRPTEAGLARFGLVAAPGS